MINSPVSITAGYQKDIVLTLPTIHVCGVTEADLHALVCGAFASLRTNGSQRAAISLMKIGGCRKEYIQTRFLVK
jgi:hypothetical protein